MERKINLLELLNYIDPATLDYSEWLSVGMALKLEGYAVGDWELWSRRDPNRYNQGECESKWKGFNGSAMPVTGASITQLAKDRGWQPSNVSTDSVYTLDWGDTINLEDRVVVNSVWLEECEVIEPEEWHPGDQIKRYLELLFDKSEYVGYVTKAKDGSPTGGHWKKTAGALIEELDKCGDDIGAAFGDYDPDVGAWIRFNPLDGEGIKDSNVTAFRYALVESDDMPIGRQNAIIREMELPVAVLVYSGGKSLHAIVRIDADTYDEYRKRVNYLYDVCKKNGFHVDSQARNPSRLSRMPGVMRGGNKQFIVDANIGKSSWAEWFEWIEGVNDDLPEPESMADVWDNMPDLSPPLIEGILRQGHKLLLAGPSKAGKSYALIQLCCSIAEGRNWFNWQCAQGRVLYVNLELDRASCLHRFRDVYEALGWKPVYLENIDIWNLRGKSVPMDKLAPKLIRRAQKKNYIAIIIDPIYKVITGDENSADQMARFCNQFDLVCHELGAAVIYCHHHSKGSQGQKRSMDRASGSGVFARDPDALLDIIELDLTEDMIKQEVNKAVCAVCADRLNKHAPNDWEDKVSHDDMLSSTAALEACSKLLPSRAYQELRDAAEDAKRDAERYSAWRIEGTLREFPRFDPVNLWFTYPVHRLDDTGALGDVKINGDNLQQSKFQAGNKKEKEDKAASRRDVLESAYDALSSFDGEVSVMDVVRYTGKSENTIKSYIKEHPGFMRENGKVIKVENGDQGE